MPVVRRPVVVLPLVLRRFWKFKLKKNDCLGRPADKCNSRVIEAHSIIPIVATLSDETIFLDVWNAVEEKTRHPRVGEERMICPICHLNRVAFALLRMHLDLSIVLIDKRNYFFIFPRYKIVTLLIWYWMMNWNFWSEMTATVTSYELSR